MAKVEHIRSGRDDLLREASRIVIKSKIDQATKNLEQTQNEMDNLLLEISQSPTGFGSEEQQQQFEILDQQYSKTEAILKTLQLETSTIEEPIEPEIRTQQEDQEDSKREDQELVEVNKEYMDGSEIDSYEDEIEQMRNEQDSEDHEQDVELDREF